MIREDHVTTPASVSDDIRSVAPKSTHVLRAGDRGPSKLAYLALPGFLVVGAALRVWQYAGDASLWLDEAFLAIGIVRTDLPGLLTEPLPYNQVAPKGFLLLQKLGVLVMGPSDYGLRIVPFICSLIALFAFARLAKSMLGGIAPAAAVLLFATAAPLISFSASVKQYSVDVCVAVLMWWLAWELISQPMTTRRAHWAALAGATLVWFSQPSVLLLTAFCTLFGIRLGLSWSRRELRLSVATMIAVWAVSALAVTLAGFASMTPETREYMLGFWATGFPPVPFSQVLDTLWPWDRVMALVGNRGAQAGLAYPLPAFYAVLAAGGLTLLWRQNHEACLLIAGPLVVTLGAAVARQYPFSDRLILFLVPAVLIAIAVAVDGIWRLVRPLSPALSGAIALGLLVPAAYPVAATPPVYLTEHIKPVLTHIEAEHRDGDGIYVYYGAGPAWGFYASQYGLDRDDYFVGGSHRGDSRCYLEDLDMFRGRSRVWVVITHAMPFLRERDDILAYLDKIGTRRDSLIITSRAVGRIPLPAEVHLYDLSDPGRASTAYAATFPLSGSSPTDQRTDCPAPQNVY